MEKLSTIQKRNNLNAVYRDGDAGPGGAHHDYVVSFSGGLPESDGDGVRIQFQCGPRNDPDARKGVCGADLLEIVRDQLREFQAGPYSCRENACALTHIEEALMWLTRRVEDRAERNVLGLGKK
ncbi:ABC transporter ATPase [Oscillospiraceae bacterium 38-13]